MSVDLPPELEERVAKALRAGRKDEAIELVEEAMGVGRRQARLLVFLFSIAGMQRLGSSELSDAHEEHHEEHEEPAPTGYGLEAPSPASGPGPGSGAAGSRWLTALFAGTTLLGVVSSYFWIQGLLGTADTYTWTTTTCTIERSWVERTDRADDPYAFRVRYRYRAGGEELVGSLWRPGYFGGTSVVEPQRLVAAYPRGAEVACLYDPVDPRRAMLEREGWIRHAIEGGIALVLLGLGVGGLRWRMRPERGGPGPSVGIERPDAPEPSLSWQPLAVFGAFFFFSLAALLPTILLPAWHEHQARDWLAVPCEVEEMRVDRRSGEDGDTYGVEVLFTYEVDGRVYRSDRFDFSTFRTSDEKSKVAAARRYPPGWKGTCWANPEDPYEAVIERRFELPRLLGGLLLAFCLVGFLGLTVTTIAGLGRAIGRRSRPTSFEEQ